MASLAKNFVAGLQTPHEVKLVIKGVGYRVAVDGKKITLTLGHSHPVEHILADGVVASCPTQTELVLRSSNKEKSSLEAARIRKWRMPDAYHGKGVNYANVQISLKEVKKMSNRADCC